MTEPPFVMSDKKTETLITVTPTPLKLCFYDNGKAVGVFEYSRDAKNWAFVGDYSASAKQFVQAILRYLPQEFKP